jgi:hypothetical protein
MFFWVHSTKRWLVLAILGALIFPLWPAQDYSRDEALRVLALIDKIRIEGQAKKGNAFEKAEVTESELNSYFAYRIKIENEEIMKELRLKLFEKNRIEGKIGIDLRGQTLPPFLKPEMNFYFEGILWTKEGWAKLEISRLFLDGQQIQPFILDWVIAVVAKLTNNKASSLNDWYELPYGLRNLETARGRLVVTY